jgi:hypothetical protein
MTRKIAGTCFAAVLGFALSAAAQTPPSSSSPSPSTPSTPQTAPAPTSPYPSSQSSSSDKMDKAGKSSKLTGCVQSGTSAGTFELTNIKKGMKSDSASASTDPGAAGASAASSKTVKLVAAAGVDLSQHVGHQVEVTGSWDKSSASASATPPSADAPASASASSKGGDFNVTDVKMVSATCSAGTN